MLGNTINTEKTYSHADKVNIFEYWHIVMRYKKMIIGIVILASIAAVVISLLLPKMYRANATIVTVSSKSSGKLGGLTSQLGGIASLAGLSLPSSGGEDEQKLEAILKSRTLTENVIKRENLMPVLFEKMWDPARGGWKTDDPEKTPTMERAVQIMKGAVKILYNKKSKTIDIEGLMRDPELVARAVNAYLRELQEFISDNAFTVAKRNRIFIEGQLEDNKRELLEAGTEINEFYRANKISNVEARVDVPIASASVLVDQKAEDAKIASEKTLLAMNDSSMFGSLLASKQDIEKKIAEAKTVKSVPQQVYLNYLMLRSELLGQVNALLTTQYEMAKIEESREDLSFQVIDRAAPPMKRYSPKRAQICIMSFMAALFFAVFLAFFRDYLQRMKAAHRAQGV